MATKSRATRGGKYVCKIGNFDIRHKITSPRRTKNLKGEVIMTPGSVEALIYIGPRLYKNGFNESLSTDNCTHSFFGISKLHSDLLVQEYGKSFNLKTAILRLGCITGPNHQGVELHGFLSYLVKSCIKYKSYKIIGYQGKQVRDNIHSYDLVKCFWEIFKRPKYAAIYNIGGGRYSNCSIIEAIN